MPLFLLHHHHEPAECEAAFAAWRGFSSPLRRHPAPSTCLAGGHALWWKVEAADQRASTRAAAGLRRAPNGPIEVRDIEIP